MLEINDRVYHLKDDSVFYILKSVDKVIALCVDDNGREYKFDIEHLRKV